MRRMGHPIPWRDEKGTFGFIRFLFVAGQLQGYGAGAAIRGSCECLKIGTEGQASNPKRCIAAFAAAGDEVHA